MKTFACDFETTVYANQTDTEVWASACVELGTNDVKIFNSIDEQFDFFCKTKGKILAYYHNLKFDGNFWLSYLLVKKKFIQAYTVDKNDVNTLEWIDNKEMPNNSFKYLISSQGQWYAITIKTNNKIIEIRDSLKLLPFSISKIGKSFGTKHKKTEMEYVGYRYAGCTITDDEKEYIANDVLVLKEALEIMFEQGHNKMTIGSCCLDEFEKTNFYQKQTTQLNLCDIPLDEKQFGCKNADRYIRNSYKGGWCYLVKGKENIERHNGCTFDVNSLYPSMMSSESGNRYPIGHPVFWVGDFPSIALRPYTYYFVRIKTRFYIKKNYLPFIQIKNNLSYMFNECLESSDIYDSKTGKYYSKYYDENGVLQDAKVTLTLTKTDYELLNEHYNLVDCEILDGCYFQTEIGLFDDYMYKYKKIKQESKGAIRELAKLFLNNLYGKMSTSTDSSFKVAYVKEDLSIGFFDVKRNDKKAGYIPIGSAITSYARNFTIRTAQKNYHGVNERGFIYADTDSIHCDIPPEQVVGIREHETDFCCWKLESEWDDAIFTRQKTYIEHIIKENREDVNPFYVVKCAGMPEKCKNLFIKSMNGVTNDELKNYNEEEQKFLKVKRTLKDFKVGLIVPSKLLPKRIKGGVILTDTTFEMR